MAKEYLALIHGRPMGPEGVWEDLLWKDKEKNHVFVVRRMRNGVKAAKLAYRSLEARENLTLVHIRLYTGRSHQIRVQFASRGFPLAGDHKYGSRDKAAAPALWSFRLTFPHPSTGRMLTFCRPPAGEIWSSFSAAFPAASPWDGRASEGGSKSAVFKEGDPAHGVRLGRKFHKRYAALPPTRWLCGRAYSVGVRSGECCLLWRTGRGPVQSGPTGYRVSNPSAGMNGARPA